MPQPKSPTKELGLSFTCPRCGRTLRERSGKLLCDHCGYFMSCSDF